LTVLWVQLISNDKTVFHLHFNDYTLNILEIQNLTKSYGNHIALSAIDLDIPKGKIFGLLGPNGAGKTTLIRIINQIIEADSGTVTFEGLPLKGDHIADIGYLPEERGLYKKMTVWDQLIYFAQLKGLSNLEAKQKIKKWLQKLEITSWRDKKIEDLSKGMAQKVQFIATIIHDPKLLILDEPFSGFDPVNAEIIKNEILELNAAGTTIVLSTHRMESVELLCDEIAMIHQSKKVLDGPVKEIKNRFRPNIYEINLLSNGKAIPDDYISFVDGETIHLKIALGSKSPNELIQELMGYGQILDFHEIVPSIEEIFIQQVKASSNG
jgi:ABC-2 type transport system ATP-binding protein